FAFDATVQSVLSRVRNLPAYFAEGRDDEGNLILNLTDAGSPYLNFGLGRSSSRRLYAEASLNYNRAFGDHEVGALLLFNQTDFSRAANYVGLYKAYFL